VEYHLIADGLVIFGDKIYVLDDIDLKKIMLMDFHVKPYLGYSRYQNPLKAMEKFYY